MFADLLQLSSSLTYKQNLSVLLISCSELLIQNHLVSGLHFNSQKFHLLCQEEWNQALTNQIVKIQSSIRRYLAKKAVSMLRDDSVRSSSYRYLLDDGDQDLGDQNFPSSVSHKTQRKKEFDLSATLAIEITSPRLPRSPRSRAKTTSASPRSKFLRKPYPQAKMQSNPPLHTSPSAPCC
jgi:hypothetical protein